jgi:polyphosphate kinase
VDEIERTIAASERGEDARILMKMNALVDRRCIRALYRASQSGVPIDLNIRGICCLRPGVPGVSDNIRVVSVLGRFLEHSRVYAFFRGDEVTVYTGSADLMPRNLDNRVELIVPVEDPAVRDDLLDAVERCLVDDSGTWDLGADRGWVRRTPAPEPRSVQRELMLGHAARAAETS